MADRYWIASSAGNWNDTANWSTTSGGSGGASVPTSADDVFFDGNGLGDCTLPNANESINKLTTATGYTGTITIYAGRTLQIGAGSPVTIETNTTISFGSASSILGLYGAGFSANNGTWTGDGVVRFDGGGNATSVGGTYPKIQFRWANNRSLIFTSDVTCTTLQFYNTNSTTGTLSNSTNDINFTITGDVESLGITGTFAWSKGTGTITLSGTSTQSIDFLGKTVEDLVIDKSAGTATLSGAVTTDSLAVNRGTIDINGQAVDVSGNVTANPVAGAFTFQDTAATGSLSITGNIDLNGTATYGGTWSDIDIDALSATGSNEAAYVTVSNSNNSSGNTITVTNGTDSGGNTGWSFGAAGISGTLNATETGTDTASLLAKILLSGSLAATETGDDTASLLGKIFLTGSLSAVETGTDTASFTSGLTAITGTLSATEIGDDTASLTGNIVITSALSATETGTDTASLTGKLLISGTLSATEVGTDTAYFVSGALPTITATLNATEVGADSAAFTGTVNITATLAATETGADSASFDATIAITGSLAATETGNDTAAFYQTQIFTGTLTAVETGDDIALFGVFNSEDTQPLSIVVELAITDEIYKILGQSIVYKGADYISHILAVVDNQDEFFPAGFESQANNGDVKARIQKADIASPQRGDLIADKDGKTYYLSSYSTLNEAEWTLELRRQNG